MIKLAILWCGFRTCSLSTAAAGSTRLYLLVGDLKEVNIVCVHFSRITYFSSTNIIHFSPQTVHHSWLSCSQFLFIMITYFDNEIYCLIIICLRESDYGLQSFIMFMYNTAIFYTLVKIFSTMCMKIWTVDFWIEDDSTLLYMICNVLFIFCEKNSNYIWLYWKRQ